MGGDHGKGGEEGRVKREVGTGGDTRRIAHLLYQDGILPQTRGLRHSFGFTPLISGKLRRHTLTPKLSIHITST